MKDWVQWDSGLQNQGTSTVRRRHLAARPTRSPPHSVPRKPPPQVLLHVTHSNLTARFMELRLDKHMTVER